MIGAIIGDIAGSIYEFKNIKTKDFPLFSSGCTFTDDSLMTIAVGSALMKTGARDQSLAPIIAGEMRRIGRAYPHPMGSYGGGFAAWLQSPNPEPYNSWGNGSAMRVSACGEAAGSLDEALSLAKISAEVTHNHPEGVKGAQAVAAAIFLLRHGMGRDDLRAYIEQNFYPLNRTLDQIRPAYAFDGSCQGTVPQAFQAFLESTSFEDALRNAVSLGGDTDTLTAIACSIAWAHYARRGPDEIMLALSTLALEMLPADLRKIVSDWESRVFLSPKAL